MKILYYDEFFEWKNSEDLYRLCLKQQKELKMKDKVINDLLKRISDLEFEVERLEKRVEQEKRIVDIKDKDIVRLYERIDKAIEYMNDTIDFSWKDNSPIKNGKSLSLNKLLDILKGVDKE